MARSKTALFEHGANLLTMATCVFGCWILWHMYQSVGAPGATTNPAVEGLTVEVPGYDFKRSDATVVITLSSTCKYCTESLPFLASLFTSQVLRERGIAVIATSLETEESLRTYLGVHGLEVEHVYSVSPDMLWVRQTPAVSIVDSGGRVVRIWRGLITKRRLDEITVALQGRVTD